MLAYIQVALLQLRSNYGIGEDHSVLLGDGAVGQLADLFIIVIDLGGHGEPVFLIAFKGLLNGVGNALSNAVNGNGLAGIHSELGNVLAVFLGPGQVLGGGDLVHQVFVIHPEDGGGVNVSSGQIQSDLEVEGLANLSRGGVDQFLADLQLAQLHLGIHHRVGKQHGIDAGDGAGGSGTVHGLFVAHLGGNTELLQPLGIQVLFQSISSTVGNALDDHGFLSVYGEGSGVLAVFLGPVQIFVGGDLAHQIGIVHPEDGIGVNVSSGQVQSDLEIEGLANLSRGGVDQVLAYIQVALLQLCSDHGIGEDHSVLLGDGAVSQLADLFIIVIDLGGHGEPVFLIAFKGLLNGVGNALRDTADGDGFAGIHSKLSNILAVFLGPGQVFIGVDLLHQVFVRHPGQRAVINIGSGQVQGDLELKGLANLSRGGVNQLLADLQLAQLQLGINVHGVGKHHCVLRGNGTLSGVALYGGTVVDLGGHIEQGPLFLGQIFFQRVGSAQRNAVDLKGFVGIQGEVCGQGIAGHRPGQSLGAYQLALDVIRGHPGNAVAHQRCSGQIQGQTEIEGFVRLGKCFVDQLLADLQSACIPAVGDAIVGDVSGNGLVAGQCAGLHEVIVTQIHS